MRESLWAWVRRRPVLRKRDIALTLIPAVLWAVGVQQGRAYFLSAPCGKSPELCQAGNVLSIDQPAIKMANSRADQLSFLTQNVSGYIAFGLPIAVSTGLAIAGRVSPLTALISAGTDILLTFQSVAWNGAINEAFRLAIQRPRPFVYNSPGTLGADPSNYTSFYSGHTSFSAASSTAFVLTLARRGAPSVVVAAAGFGGLGLMGLTGLFRVLAGRHFFTDVLAGGLAGILIATWIAFVHQRERQKRCPPAG